MKEQSSFRERAKFSRRILCSRERILRSPMPNEHPALERISSVDVQAIYVSQHLPTVQFPVFKKRGRMPSSLPLLRTC